MCCVKRIKCPRALILSAALFLWCQTACASEWKQLHERADKTSLDEAQAAVRENPFSTDDLYLLGLVCLNHHQDDRAKEAFDKVLSADPENYRARWGLAEVLRRKHQSTQAEELLGPIMKTRPDFSPAYITQAYIEYYKREFDTAIRLARTVIKQGWDNVDISNYTRAYLIIGGCKGMIAYFGGPLSKLINGTEVMPMLKNAAVLQPDSAGVSFGLGSFYFMAPGIIGGNIDKGIDYLQKAVKADPLFADAYVRLGQAYRIKGDNLNYEQYLAKALEIDPANELALDVQSGRCRFICTPAKEK
jgi:tetratricopeptide (TPR) repeat protein